MLVGAYLALVVSAVSLCSLEFSRRYNVVLILLFILAASLVHQTILNTLSEDAFITFRYSQNLADGHGAVFNIGERVEGYSNFLLMILLAGANYVFSLPIVETGRVAGSLFMLLSIVLTFSLTRQLTDGKTLPALIACLLLASSGIFVGWGPSGMETTLFALLILLLLGAIFRNRPITAGILVSLATMTRPEGILLVFVYVFWMIAISRKSDETRASVLRSAIRFFVPVFAILGVWTVWRVSYYGYLLPNPIAAKSGMDQLHQLAFGLEYLYRFAKANIVLFFLVILALILIWRSKERLTLLRLATSKLMTIIFAVLLYSAFYTVIGGDWMPLLRFYAPLIPLIAITIGKLFDVVLDVYPQQASRGIVLGVLGTAAIANLAVTAFNPEMAKRNSMWQEYISAIEEIGNWIKTATPEGATVATFANGIFSYTLGADYYVIDVLGLTDEHVARRGQRLSFGLPGHIAYDWDYVVQRQPDIIFISGQGFHTTPNTDNRRPEFENDYLPVVLRLEEARPYGRFLKIEVRRDRYDEIVSAMLHVDGFEATLFEGEESSNLSTSGNAAAEP